MKAIVVEEFGGVEELKLKEVDDPDLKPDRMLVDVFATSVNPVDFKRRKGLFGGSLPMIVGGDVAGKVTKVGTDVTDFKVGDRIMANGSKTYAEIVSVNPDRAVKLDDSISFEEAAAVPLTGQTAYEAVVKRGKVSPGDKVLIHAGSGGVGSFAVQIAKIKGAWIASTASEKHQGLLASLGVDRPVNYQEEDFSATLSDMDLVLDTLGGDIQEKSFSVLKRNGKLLSIVEEPEDNGAETTFFSMKPTKEGLEQLHEWLRDKKVSPVIAHVYSFTEKEVREAHRLSETGHAGGKLVIKIKEK